MSDQSLILSQGFVVQGFNAQAEALKESALAQSALISAVNNAGENQTAFGAASEITGLRRQIRAAYEFRSRPALDYLESLRKQVKDFDGELEEEETRLNTLIGNYQQHEKARLKDAIIAASGTLEEIDQQRHEALSKVANDDERDEINERFDQMAKNVQQPTAPRAEGQTLKSDWDVTVTDIHALYKFHRDCVKLTALVSEVKELLKLGITVKGVTATPVTKSQSRSKKQQKVIEV